MVTMQPQTIYINNKKFIDVTTTTCATRILGIEEARQLTLGNHVTIGCNKDSSKKESK